MDKTEVLIDTNKGGFVSARMRQAESSVWMPSVVDEGPESSDVTCTGFSDSSFSTLVSDTNSHLSGSTSRLLGITYGTSGIVSISHYAIVVEVSKT